MNIDFCRCRDCKHLVDIKLTKDIDGQFSEGFCNVYKMRGAADTNTYCESFTKINSKARNKQIHL